jgi:dienelactone hydrolase
MLGLLCTVIAGNAAHPEEAKPIKRGLEPADYVYRLAEGVTRREVTYYSDGVACFAVMFFPKGYSPTGKAPGVVLAQGWAGTHVSSEKYGARFAEKGLVAMVIDYRGWGLSDGYATLAHRLKNDDSTRFTQTKAEVMIKRTRLVPFAQVQDIRSSLSYLQGEPGIDPERIGLWGSSYGGGNAIVVAALDARAKALVLQTPAIAGKGQPSGPMKLQGKMLDDAIKRARDGQGAEYETGFGTRRNIDVETNQLVAEYRPFRYVEKVGERPVLFIVAGSEQLFNNRDHAYAAAELLPGPKKVLEVPNVTHFEMYINDAFDISANAAADWFRDYLSSTRTN